MPVLRSDTWIEIHKDCRWAQRRLGRRITQSKDGRYYITARGLRASMSKAQMVRMINEGAFMVVPKSHGSKLEERRVDSLAVQAGERLDAEADAQEAASARLKESKPKAKTKTKAKSNA